LQRLNRRARKYRRGNIPDRKDASAIRIGDRDSPAMPAFHQAAAKRFDEDWIAHSAASANRGARFSRLAVTASA